MRVKVNQMDGEEIELLKGYLSAAEVAEELGLTSRRVRQFIKEKRLTAVKVGNMWMVTRESVAAFKGKPRKSGKPIESN
jgi:excisionase family DNA binding protein